MNPSRNEHTIATNCQVSGRGYWTGQDVRVEIYPASAGTGIQFVRTDLDELQVARQLWRIDATLICVPYYGKMLPDSR